MKNLRLFVTTGIPNSTFKRLKRVRLLHPRLGTKCVFIVSEDFNDIYELQKISLPGRSFIVGNQISKCGDIFVPSLINVIFLFIPSLLKMDKFTTLDVLVRSECAPGFPTFFPSSTFDKLCAICESKVTCGLRVLRLSEEKLLDWLNATFDLICEAAHRIDDCRQICQSKAILTSSGDGFNIAATPSKDSPTAALKGLDSSALKNLAFQIIADKLPYQLVDKLFSSVGLVALPSDAKENDLTEDGVAVVKTAKSALQNKRMKMAKGTKPIMSFFCKK